MSDCRKCRDLMIEALYGELGPAEQEAFDRHCQACPSCAAERRAAAEALKLMDRRRRPDPGPEFWDGYWDRLSRRLIWEATANGRRPSLASRLGGLFARLPRWSYQAAGAAALILAGILIGRLALGPAGRAGKAPDAGAPLMTGVPAGSPSAAVVRAGDFVDRSQVLLLGLVNHDPATEDAYAFDFDGKKAASRALAAQAPAVRQGLQGPGERRLRELVGDLEVIMMQIANLESGQDLEGVEMVKQGIDRKGLFLKIDLARMGRGAAPLPKKSQV
ncbi:MAG TPA: zf-HC2 domain-containing protein [Candidatus Aminicenantes bacterium]|nr:zf-HC2 domain-containing protein [Candidatus Aminicenantes bacterium]HRY66207.1 zf-HC2 domain-containing protein [Candidatus Aminicenantes bacterium]HRZ73121.1 zf-HC2 domain-containing protein [Candidatus Aminicenantes bacterium]